MEPAKIRTDWPGLVVSLLVPMVVIAGLVGTALQKGSLEDTPVWSWGLVVLIPLEGLRVFVMNVTSSIYELYAGPRQAVIYFISFMVMSAVVVVVLMLLPGRNGDRLSLHEFAAILSNPMVWQVMLVPMVIVVVETALGLLLFRGDTRAQSERLAAVADTSEFWLMVALFYPVVFALTAFSLLSFVGGSQFVDTILVHLRTVVFLYAAFYFTGKAVLLAYLHTSSFLRKGRLPFFKKREGRPLTLQEIMDRQHDVKKGM
jgi:hypothetical protein